MTFRAIREKTAAALQAIKSDAALTSGQKPLKVRETVQAQRSEMRAALTSEQRSKLEQIRKRLLAPLGPLATT